MRCEICEENKRTTIYSRYCDACRDDFKDSDNR